jgi:hypothetical protein
MAQQNVTLTRAFINMVNVQKVAETVDFAASEYIALRTFFDELSVIQSQIVKGEKLKLSTGDEIDMNSTGGLVALQLYMDALDQAKQSMLGLARLGLKTENELWKKK